MTFFTNTQELSGLITEASSAHEALMGRRHFLGLGAAWLVGSANAGQTAPPGVNIDFFWEQPRYVWLKRAATGEVIKEEYWRDGKLNQEAYLKISWFMRDLRFEKMLANRDPLIARGLNLGVIRQEHLSCWMHMNPIILDILFAHCAWLAHFGIQSPLLLTSALRHLITNAITEGAARDSWHTLGGASDIVIPGVTSKAIAQFSQWLSGGGVGLYQTKHFVHLDCGRVRSWKG